LPDSTHRPLRLGDSVARPLMSSRTKTSPTAPRVCGWCRGRT
jgi:hypothetical protein